MSSFCIKQKLTRFNNLIPLKREMVAGVTVLTLGSGGSSFLIEGPFNKAGLLSMIAIDKCFVNGMLAATRQ